MSSIDIVIVNWNSGSYLRDCLVALDQCADAGRLNLVVVDNASTDHSATGLAVDRAQLHFIKNADNRGFAKASNQGAREGSAPYLLFLNPDVRVEADTVKTAVASLDDPGHSDVGILGVQLIDNEGRIQRCCARAPTIATLLLHRLFLDRLCPGLVPPHFLTGWDHCATAKVDQVMGAFLLIRRAIFEQLGGFDERFFLYYEDVDLCRRRAAGGLAGVVFCRGPRNTCGRGLDQFGQGVAIISPRDQQNRVHRKVAWSGCGLRVDCVDCVPRTANSMAACDGGTLAARG